MPSQGKWAGSWPGSNQSRPAASRPYTRKDMGYLEGRYFAAFNKYGAQHRTTKAHRASLARAIASYNATHREPWKEKTP